MTYKPLRCSQTSAPAPIDLVLKIATALLISFAAALVLVHAEVYFARLALS